MNPAYIGKYYYCINSFKEFFNNNIIYKKIKWVSRNVYL